MEQTYPIGLRKLYKKKKKEERKKKESLVVMVTEHGF